MIDLRALGALDLRRRSGPELHSVLAQPKRTALLLFLALARPRGFHRRDSLIALFWPEHDTEHARASLRQSIHFLRRSLGEEAILSRGDEDIGLGDGVLSCDAVLFDAALDAGELERGLALYAGDLLPGFFVDEAPEFERWLEAERTRLRERALRACWSLAETSEGDGDPATAAEWGRRALAICPADDTEIMRLMQLLARAGDRSGALAAYEAYARRLRAELDVEPTDAARALADEIRRAQPRATYHAPSLTPVSARELAHTARPAARRPSAGAEPEAGADAGSESAAGSEAVTGAEAADAAGAEVLFGAEAAAGAPRTGATTAAPPQRAEPAALPEEAAAGALVPEGAAVAESRPAIRRIWLRRGGVLALASGLATIALGSWFVLRPGPREVLAPAAPPPPHLAILYFEDSPPDPAVRVIATLVTENLIEQLNASPGLVVVSPAGVEPFRGKHLSPDSIGRALKVSTVVSGAIRREAGFIRVRIDITDTASADTRATETIRRREPAGEAPTLANDIAHDAAVFLRRHIGEAVRLSDRPAQVRDEAWSLFQRGREAQANGEILLDAGEQEATLAAWRRADSLFAGAERADPRWTRPTLERGLLASSIAFVASAPGGRDTAERRRAIERGIGHVNRALRLNSRDAAALELRGVLRFRLWVYSARHGPRSAEVLAAADSDAHAAITLDPHRAAAWSTLASTRWQAVDFAGTQAAAEQALQEDAYAADGGANLWLAFESSLQLRQDARAAEWCDELRRRNRSQAVAVVCALELQAWGEAPPDLAAATRARREFGTPGEADQRPIVDLVYAAVLARAGLRDSALALIAGAADPSQPVLARREAEARVLLHQEDAAIRLLGLYLAAFPDQRLNIARDRYYASLRTRPAFQALVRGRTGAGRDR